MFLAFAPMLTTSATTMSDHHQYDPEHHPEALAQSPNPRVQVPPASRLGPLAREPNLFPARKEGGLMSLVSFMGASRFQDLIPGFKFRRLHMVYKDA